MLGVKKHAKVLKATHPTESRVSASSDGMSLFAVQLKAQGPSRTCSESKEEEEEVQAAARASGFRTATCLSFIA